MTVVALDSQDDPVTTYTGPATVKISDTGTGASYPTSPVSFTNGSATFPVTFVTAGPQSVTVTDAANSLSATLNVKVVNPVAAASYAISLAPSATPGGQTMWPTPTNGTPNVAAGTPFTVAVVALDANSRPDYTYNGTAKVVVSDTVTGVSYPATVTFQNGYATFPVTLVTPGAQTVTVTDQQTATLTATLNLNVVNPNLVASYAVQLTPATANPVQMPPSAGGVPNVPENQPVSITVTALNGLNQPLTSYTGPANVTITGTASTITYPQSVTFTKGVATLDPTFVATGPQTVTVADATNTAVTATLKVNVVVPIAAASYAISLAPVATPGGQPVSTPTNGTPNVAAGTPFTVSVLALDAHGRRDPDYDGTAKVVVSDTVTGVTYPATVTFQNGLATFQVTLVTPGADRDGHRSANCHADGHLEPQRGQSEPGGKLRHPTHAGRHQPGPAAFGRRCAERAREPTGGHYGDRAERAEPAADRLHRPGERDDHRHREHDYLSAKRDLYQGRRHP